MKMLASWKRSVSQRAFAASMRARAMLMALSALCSWWPAGFGRSRIPSAFRPSSVHLNVASASVRISLTVSPYAVYLFFMLVNAVSMCLACFVCSGIMLM